MLKDFTDKPHPHGFRCPDHDAPLLGQRTRFGWLFGCRSPDCTVVCWSGMTSTPGDDETRELRRRCHLGFDQLWRKKYRGPLKFKSRSEAYDWLAVAVGVPRDLAHIGMFDKHQCRRLLSLLPASVLTKAGA